VGDAAVTGDLVLSRARLRRNGAAGSLARLLDRAVAVEGDHRLIWSLFGDDDGQARDFLYRQADTGLYYILSRRSPTDAGGLWRIESKPFHPALSVGQRLRFMLRANPAFRAGRKSEEGAGRRHDVVMNRKRNAAGDDEASPRHREREAGLAWLAARSERAGFAFDADEVSVSGYLQHRLPRGGGRPDVRFSSLDFEGILTVADPDAFMATIARGLGPAKAFGCGLILIRPHR